MWPGERQDKNNEAGRKRKQQCSLEGQRINVTSNDDGE
jgi:hypothetical protein